MANRKPFTPRASEEGADVLGASEPGNWSWVLFGDSVSSPSVAVTPSLGRSCSKMLDVSFFPPDAVVFVTPPVTVVLADPSVTAGASVSVAVLLLLVLVPLVLLLMVLLLLPVDASSPPTVAAELFVVFPPVVTCGASVGLVALGAGVDGVVVVVVALLVVVLLVEVVVVVVVVVAFEEPAVPLPLEGESVPVPLTTDVFVVFNDDDGGGVVN